MIDVAMVEEAAYSTKWYTCPSEQVYGDWMMMMKERERVKEKKRKCICFIQWMSKLYPWVDRMNGPRGRMFASLVSHLISYCLVNDVSMSWSSGNSLSLSPSCSWVRSRHCFSHLFLVVSSRFLWVLITFASRSASELVSLWLEGSQGRQMQSSLIQWRRGEIPQPSLLSNVQFKETWYTSHLESSSQYWIWLWRAQCEK